MAEDGVEHIPGLRIRGLPARLLAGKAFALHRSSIMSLGYMTMVCHKFFLLGQALRAGSESGSCVLAAARSAGVLRRPVRRQDEASAS